MAFLYRAIIKGEATYKLEELHVLRPYYDKEAIVREIEETLESGWTGDGGKTVEFENKWAEFTGWKYNIYVNSCTAALHLALLALRKKFPEKTQVIVPDITFVSTAAVVEQTGLELILCDINESLTIDIEKLKKKINEKTLGVFFVGVGGNDKNLKQVEEICSEQKVELIIDAAHMGGSKLSDGRELSTVNSAFCCYSFQAVKNLGIADSGMISFNDEDFTSDVKKYRWLGINQTTYERTVSKDAVKSYKWEYEIDRIGYKYNGNALIAACCLGVMKNLTSDNQHRRNIREWYSQELQDLATVNFIKHSNEEYTSGHLAQVLIKSIETQHERNQIIEKLNSEKIYPGVHYRPLSMTQYYKSKGMDCQDSRRIGSKIISLPCHMGITHKDVVRVANALKTYV